MTEVASGGAPTPPACPAQDVRRDGLGVSSNVAGAQISSNYAQTATFTARRYAGGAARLVVGDGKRRSRPR